MLSKTENSTQLLKTIRVLKVYVYDVIFKKSFYLLIFNCVYNSSRENVFPGKVSTDLAPGKLNLKER